MRNKRVGLCMMNVQPHSFIVYRNPPSNRIICPVRYAGICARRRRASATSSGVAKRPDGISSARAARSSSEKQRFISVSMTPQARALTEILLGASSFAKASVKPFNPALDAEYAASQEAPEHPQTEDTFRMTPQGL